KRCQTLLAIDDGSLLHQPSRPLHLLQDDSPEEMRVLLVLGPTQHPIGHSNDVVPKGIPLVFLVPDIGTLEERNDKPLGLHKYHLRGADLGLQFLCPLVTPDHLLAYVPVADVASVRMLRLRLACLSRAWPALGRCQARQSQPFFMPLAEVAGGGDRSMSENT